jgi:3-methyl-2-oxobutanoate hydroxymethyltransferase
VTAAPGRVTVGSLQEMKRRGRKIVAVVAWDCQLAAIADRAGAEIVSVGDSVGVHLWGQPDPLAVTMEQMLVVTAAVRRGVDRALVSADVPFGPVQDGPAAARAAAAALAEEGGADLVKLDAAADHPEAVAAVAGAGIPVWAQFGLTPQTAERHGVSYADVMAGAQVPAGLAGELVAAAVRLHEAGASLLDFTGSGPAAGAAVARAVPVPVLGGRGGGPWLDGRVRLAHAAIGYAAAGLESEPDSYANVARVALDALTRYAGDVRGGRPVRGDNR